MYASIVVPGYNRRDEIELLLTSLNHQITEGDTFEVIVVDDGSVDGTGDLVKQFEARYDLKYLYLPRSADSCRSAARNHGIENARGEVVVMLDSDQIAPPRLVAEHLRAHRLSPAAVVLGPRTNLHAGPVDLDSLTHHFDLRFLPPIRRADVRTYVLAGLSENINDLAGRWHLMLSCNVSVRRADLLAVGGFDERFKLWGFEDTELGYRLDRHGLCFLFNPGAASLSPDAVRSSTEERIIGWQTNFPLMYARHPDPEVAAQGVFAGVFNHVEKTLSWRDAFDRFEFAVRAMRGRTPYGGDVRYMKVHENNASQLVEELEAGAPQEDRVYIDRVGSNELLMRMQCIDTPFEFAYFRDPDIKQLRTIARRYGADPMN